MARAIPCDWWDTGVARGPRFGPPPWLSGPYGAAGRRTRPRLEMGGAQSQQEAPLAAEARPSTVSPLHPPTRPPTHSPTHPRTHTHAHTPPSTFDACAAQTSRAPSVGQRPEVVEPPPRATSRGCTSLSGALSPPPPVLFLCIPPAALSLSRLWAAIPSLRAHRYSATHGGRREPAGHVLSC